MPKHPKGSIDVTERTGVLRQGRNHKMAGSAHAYVRGNTRKRRPALNTAGSM
jgi:hypothetical protein